METNQIRLGRLIDHVQLVAADFAATKKFYSAVFEVLGIPPTMQGGEYVAFDELFISSKKFDEEAKRSELGPIHLAFQAKSREHVDRFHRVGLENGGKDDGKPGERPYHPGYYAAFLVDPCGNFVEAVHHGDGKRSADAVTVTWE